MRTHKNNAAIVSVHCVCGEWGWGWSGRGGSKQAGTGKRRPTGIGDTIVVSAVSLILGLVLFPKDVTDEGTERWAPVCSHIHQPHAGGPWDTRSTGDLSMSRGKTVGCVRDCGLLCQEHSGEAEGENSDTAVVLWPPSSIAAQCSQLWDQGFG